MPVKRILSLGEVRFETGYGWLETWLKPDPDEGGGDRRDLCEVVYLNGHVMDESGSLVNMDRLRESYNRAYGERVWNERPTAEEMDLMSWEGETGYGETETDRG